MLAVFVCNVPSDDDDGDINAVKITQINRGRRRKAKIGNRWRQPLGDISKIQAQNDQKVKTKRTPSDGDDIRVLSKDLANHAKATLIRLKEAEQRAQSATKKLHCELIKQVTCLESYLVEERLTVKLLGEALSSSKEADTALKEEVATIKGKYETLASDHANVKRDYESRINQKDEELNNSNAQITQFQAQLSTLTEEKDQLAMKLDDEYHCKECVVCQESRKECAFLPCRHLCVCRGCAESIQGRDRTCPLCRGVSTSIMKIFH